ncbi:MAG TPA: PP2C family protein-serine/threonine phosphatase [Ignavibacteriaceae bacterium]|nr:PP2C family protein-serine/threonine phosphatase [Ignavibacteriaceae bacterium]
MIKTRIKKLYNFYTSDLTMKDVEKLVKRDVPELYDFYVRKMQKPGKAKNKFYEIILFIRNLFIEFLEQLTPIRRVLFSFSILVFILSYFNNNWQWAAIAFVLLCLLIAFELADKLTAKDELSVAREIQRSLMPKNAPENNFYEISCFTENAKEVGGDYYDFINPENSEGRFFIIVGDVSGKGMAAALHMVQVQSILRNSVFNHDTPKEVLISMNRNLRRVLPKGSFFTVCISSINEDGSVLLSRAGHLPLLYYKRKEDCFINITPKGMGIGIAENGLFEKNLEEICIKPEEGDILVFYTDGVIEARNLYKMEFGEERLKSIIRLNKNNPPENIKNKIVENISLFRDGTPPHDDLTLVILKTGNPLL